MESSSVGGGDLGLPTTGLQPEPPAALKLFGAHERCSVGRPTTMNLEKSFATFASATSRACGHPLTFVAALGTVIVWAVTGPMFKFSETWQLVINTGTTIVTFMMVFLIQNTQNRDNAAVQAKLDELILTSKADNRYIGIEKMTDSQLQELQHACARAAERHQAVSDRAAAEVRARKGQGRPPASRKRSAQLRKQTA
jgi:low affinity Fe/Cu permease